MNYLLTLILFLPALGALLGIFIDLKSIRLYGIFIAFVEFIFCLYLIFSFFYTIGDIKFIEDISIIKKFGIDYYVGVDGVSLIFVVIYSFLILMLLINFNFKKNIKQIILIILLFLSILNTITLSYNFIITYIFFEISLLALLFISIFMDQKLNKFYIYLMISSIVLLLGVLYLGVKFSILEGGVNFNFLDLLKLKLGFNTQIGIFFTFFLIMSFLLPFFGFNTFFIDLISKLNPLLLILFLSLQKAMIFLVIKFDISLFYDALSFLSDFIIIFCFLNIFYISIISYNQKDIKKQIAYNIIINSNFSLIGIFTLSSYGFCGALFLIVGNLLSIALISLIISKLNAKTFLNSKKLDISLFFLAYSNFLFIPLSLTFIGNLYIYVAFLKISIFYFCLMVFVNIFILISFIKFYKTLKSEQCFKIKDVIKLSPIAALIIILTLLPWIISDLGLDSFKKSINFIEQRGNTLTKQMIKKGKI